ncbi:MULTISPECIES: cellulose binding domain-containing protein [unclassified Micromonospora]|uniref:cellulose binding domain-containing protein n=1 Tax=unclassified Micromonospora TaxID=2617518 RepID=UPI002FF3D885
MPSSPPQQRRTVPIIVLDRIVALAGHCRHAVTRLRGLSRHTPVLIVASLAVLVAAAVPVVMILRTPERLAPVALPPADMPLPTGSAEARPGQARPAASNAPGTARTTTPLVDPSAVRVTPPSPDAPSPTPNTPVALTAAFVIEDRALLSYGAGVTISNAGRARATNWTLVITLPRETLQISSVTGARATQEGARWTFVPDETTTEVPPGGFVRVTFRVSGAAISSTPTACTINGAACTGLPD